MGNALAAPIEDTRLRVALVWPHGFDLYQSLPLSLGYLASNLDHDKFNVKLIDCVYYDADHQSEWLRDELQAFAPQVIGLTCFSPMFPEVLEVAKLAKTLNPEVATIIGGCHATSYSENVMKNPEFDFLFRGEGELGFNDFLSEFASGKPDYSKVKGLMFRTPKGAVVSNGISYVENLDEVKLPDYYFMNLKEYVQKGYRLNSQKKRNAPILATRGCPYRCTFCAAPDLNGKTIRTHSVEYLLNWIEMLYREHRVQWVNIIDDNFTLNKRFAKDFCRGVLEKKYKRLKFGTPNGIRMTKGDPELWSLMKKAGWKALVVAPESGSQRTVNIMKKDLDLKVVPRIVREIKAAGLKVQGFFIVGYPGETKEDVALTTKMIRENPFDFVSLHAFQPLPGTPVYDELVRNGEIPDGILPKKYNTGETVYVTEALKDLDLPGIVLRTYFELLLRRPRNFVYILSMYSPMLLARRLLENIWRSLFSTRQNSAFDKPISLVGATETGATQ